MDMDDIVNHILLFVNFKSLPACQLVSKQWYHILINDYFWSTKTQLDYFDMTLQHASWRDAYCCLHQSIKRKVRDGSYQLLMMHHDDNYLEFYLDYLRDLYVGNYLMSTIHIAESVTQVSYFCEWYIYYISYENLYSYEYICGDKTLIYQNVKQFIGINSMLIIILDLDHCVYGLEDCLDSVKTRIATNVKKIAFTDNTLTMFNRENDSVLEVHIDEL